MSQLSESEIRFMKIDAANNVLQDEKNLLIMDIDEMKKQMDSKFSVDYYIFSLIALVCNLFRALY